MRKRKRTFFFIKVRSDRYVTRFRVTLSVCASIFSRAVLSIIYPCYRRTHSAMEHIAIYLMDQSILLATVVDVALHSTFPDASLNLQCM